MADVSQITVGSETRDIKDTVARQGVSNNATNIQSNTTNIATIQQDLTTITGASAQTYFNVTYNKYGKVVQLTITSNQTLSSGHYQITLPYTPIISQMVIVHWGSTPTGYIATIGGNKGATVVITLQSDQHAEMTYITSD